MVGAARLGGVAGQYYLRYFTATRRRRSGRSIFRATNWPAAGSFRIEVLDTWNMTTTPVEGEFVMQKRADTKYFFHDPARPTITLPGRVDDGRAGDAGEVAHPRCRLCASVGLKTSQERRH